MNRLNIEVSKFLDDLQHPLRAEIDHLRFTILNTDPGITENIKWNGPNYRFEDDDRITMRIHPHTQIQLIFHRGAKKQVQPKEKIINDKSNLLVWKENDRAVASFKNMSAITQCEPQLRELVRQWLQAAKSRITKG
jgi:hypothetical protein